MTNTASPRTDAPKQLPLPVMSRLYNAATISAAQGVLTPMMWFKDWHSWFYPPGFAPTIVKTYECRPYLPVRIFFPKSYDQTSPQTLPTVYTIHGGGFCIGQPQDDDEWNARFASMHNVLVIALSYRKAPFYPFPTATYDVEALMLAAYDDESLPIDKSRIAVGGFSAGGNLTLSVCQLPSIREKVKPSAALPIYPVVDNTYDSDDKVKTRYYKPNLSPGLRTQPVDYLARMSPIFQWSYVPIGQDMADPLLSPYFAPRDTLPPHIFIVGAELDQLAHEGWRMACKIAGRPEPAFADKVGQEMPASGKGELVLDNERFAFEHVDSAGKNSVRWLLVPDQVHGFDHLPPRWQGGEESMQDAELKTVAYQKVVGEWLRDVVWKC